MMANWISVTEARARILSAIQPLDATTEQRTLPVADALQRVVAEDIVAPFNVPGHDNSAMDGYACHVQDVETLDADGAVLDVVGESFAGHPFAGGFPRGSCVKIMTGARLPTGASIVVPQEETATVTAAAGKIRINPAPKRGAGLNMRMAGEDLRTGDVALAAGCLCHPAEIGLLASLGLETAAFFRPLRVAFFSTGDEVRAVGEPLGESDVYDSNRHTIRAMIQRLGMTPVDYGIVRDDKATLAAVVDEASAAADVIVTSGGASVGEADHIRAVLAERGEVLFWKVAMRPGRPLAYGKIGATDFFGLPGNPVSVMVCFYQFVQQALWRRAGRRAAAALPLLSAATTTALRKAPGRREYQRGFLQRNAVGEWTVTVTGDQGSGILSSMTRANCFIVLPDDGEKVPSGAMVLVQPFEGMV